MMVKLKGVLGIFRTPSPETHANYGTMVVGGSCLGIALGLLKDALPPKGDPWLVTGLCTGSSHCENNLAVTPVTLQVPKANEADLAAWTGFPSSLSKVMKKLISCVRRAA